MTEVKSPFLVVQNFISPLMCEHIVDSADYTVPDVNTKGFPVRTIKRNEKAEQLLFEKFEQIIPQIEEYYNIEYRGTEPMFVEWYPEESEGEPQCESSSFLRKKWVKTKDRDFSCVLFLSDYQNTVPFDAEFEVFGGVLEFPQWGFGFNPQRGTLIVFPSGPHFVNVTTKINVGELFQVRMHMAAQQTYLFDAKNFPGDYRFWFKDVS
jgi:hypothetical protein